MKKLFIVVHLLFLGIILVSALHYIDIGRWKNYVQLFGVVETLVVVVSVILIAIKKYRITTLKYIYILLGVMQLFPMVGAFGLSMERYTMHGFFHLALVIWCVVVVIFLNRKILYKT